MTHPQGPGTPFELLFSDFQAQEPSLPESFRSIYPGDWQMPDYAGRPFIYSNFAQARDGRISFNAPELYSGGYVSDFNPHDRWLMGLLRMRADAIMSGDTTVNIEPEHLWTAEFICPQDAEAFAAQRQIEGFGPAPILVILSFDGNINLHGVVFGRDDQHIVIGTTDKGAEKLGDMDVEATVDIHALGNEAANLQRMVEILYSEYGVRNLLCEGGARLFAGMLDAGLVDEEFVTLCPTFVGRSTEHPRPSYTEGVAWWPKTAPYSKPITLHRAGDYLFLRTRCQYKREI